MFLQNIIIITSGVVHWTGPSDRSALGYVLSIIAYRKRTGHKIEIVTTTTIREGGYVLYLTDAVVRNKSMVKERVLPWCVKLQGFQLVGN